MAYMHLCPVCTEPGTVEWYHSTYLKNPINYGENPVTHKRHYHSNQMEADTLAGIKAKIRHTEQDGLW